MNSKMPNAWLQAFALEWDGWWVSRFEAARDEIRCPGIISQDYEASQAGVACRWRDSSNLSRFEYVLQFHLIFPGLSKHFPLNISKKLFAWKKHTMWLEEDTRSFQGILSQSLPGRWQTCHRCNVIWRVLRAIPFQRETWVGTSVDEKIAWQFRGIHGSVYAIVLVVSLGSEKCLSQTTDCSDCPDFQGLVYVQNVDTVLNRRRWRHHWSTCGFSTQRKPGKIPQHSIWWNEWTEPNLIWSRWLPLLSRYAMICDIQWDFDLCGRAIPCGYLVFVHLRCRGM